MYIYIINLIHIIYIYRYTIHIKLMLLLPPVRDVKVMNPMMILDLLRAEVPSTLVVEAMKHVAVLNMLTGTGSKGELVIFLDESWVKLLRLVWKWI